MKFVKMLGLLAIAAAALMAFAGSASATQLTNSKGEVLPAGTKIVAEGEEPHTKLDGTVTVTCAKSIVEGEVTNAGGANATVSGSITHLTFLECGANTVTVTAPGKLEIHTDPESPQDGTLTSTGARVTVVTHNILGTVHCIYETKETDIGTLTSSKTLKGSTATLDIGSAPIPEVETDTFACKNDALWTGNYKVTSPDYLDVH